MMLQQKLSQWKKLLPKSFVHLLKGSVLSQVIILASTPILTRLYGPGEIGEFLFIFFIAAIVGESSTLRLESALFVERRRANLRWLKGGALTTSLLISIAALPLLLLSFAWRNGGLSANVVLISLLAATIAFSFGARHTMHAWALREGQTQLAARALVVKAVILVVLQITLGLYYRQSESLLIAELVSTFGMLVVLNHVFQIRFDLLPVYMNIRVIKWNIRNYVRFVVYETPAYLIRSVVARLPIIALTLIFGTEKAGLYGLTYQIVQLPNRHIGGNMGDVIQMEAGELVREKQSGNLMSLLQRYSIILGAIAVLPFIVIMLLAPDLFPWVLGKEWKDSGTIAQMLAPWMFAGLVVPTVSRVLLVIQRQDVKLRFDGLMLAVLVSIFCISYFFVLDFTVLILLISFSFVLIYVLYYLAIYKCISETGDLQN